MVHRAVDIFRKAEEVYNEVKEEIKKYGEVTCYQPDIGDMEGIINKSGRTFKYSFSVETKGRRYNLKIRLSVCDTATRKGITFLIDINKHNSSLNMLYISNLGPGNDCDVTWRGGNSHEIPDEETTRRLIHVLDLIKEDPGQLWKYPVNAPDELNNVIERIKTLSNKIDSLYDKLCTNGVIETITNVTDALKVQLDKLKTIEIPAVLSITLDGIIKEQKQHDGSTVTEVKRNLTYWDALGVKGWELNSEIYSNSELKRDMKMLYTDNIGPMLEYVHVNSKGREHEEIRFYNSTLGLHQFPSEIEIKLLNVSEGLKLPGILRYIPHGLGTTVQTVVKSLDKIVEGVERASRYVEAKRKLKEVMKHTEEEGLTI